MLWKTLNRRKIIFTFLAVIGIGSSHTEIVNASDRPTPRIPMSAMPEYLEIPNTTLQVNRQLDACLPLLNYHEKTVFHFHITCSEKAWEEEGKPFSVSKNFEVPPEFTRRVRFWNRIFSLVSAKEFVIHLPDYPEIIFEIVRFDDIAINLGLTQQKKKYLNGRKTYYQSLLKEMEKLTPEEWTEDMKRISVMFGHITDSGKYSNAAKDIRIQRGQREYFERGLEAYTAYIFKIEEEFAKEMIPIELARIAFIESSFNLKAISKVGASGVYQLMPFVGKKFMIVDSRIDERRDPIKSAGAAAKVFKQNYQMLGSWPLAVTAYNHGPYGIKRAVKQVGSNELLDLIEKYERKSFGFASQNFYAEFLAILGIFKDARIHFPDLKIQRPLNYEIHILKKRATLQSLAREFKVDTMELAQLNPDILPKTVKSGLLLPRGYQLKIPKASNEMAKNWESEVWRAIAFEEQNQNPLAAEEDFFKFEPQ